MTKSTCTAFLLICLATSVTSYGASPEQVVSLTKAADIRDASAMDQAIVRLSKKVMECVQGKLAPANECFCHYPQELSNVRKTYEVTTKRHPDWKNKTISYTSEGTTHAVSFGGLSRQLQTKCPANK